MFGYVRPSMNRLSAEEQERFSAVYCGLCRVLGERYGTAARFILNYDFAFLVLLLATPTAEKVRHSRCMAHPVHGRDYYPCNDALELAADCSVILTWWQLCDGIQDHTVVSGLKYRAASTVLDRAYRKARRYRPEFDRSTREHLDKLRKLEQEKCPSMDAAADAFAKLLQGISAQVNDPIHARVLEQMLYHLGRWIYLVDAADDLAEDAKDGNYNPLIERFSLTTGVLTPEAKESLVISLDHSIRLIAAAYELWDFGVWSEIIRSTVYEGLFFVGKAVLEGTFHAAKKEKRGRDEEHL
ncbi:MAG: hypothetical protein IJ955_05665 [Oscillospiraceae bacterium]|nr:hypothetical protein [Oscillospiraceae bacterium]